MQKAPVMKGSGLKPLDDSKTNEEVHVFGRNLEERVVANDQEESTSISFNNFQRDIEHTNADDDIESIRKRKFDAITGEEDEETIFQGEFKLFVWDLATSNWIEKGRGQLKLNDSIDQNEKKSRLIMRVSGTLRIILNVAIKRSFFRIIANSKSNLRFTDSQSVWAASGSNAHQLKDLIEERLEWAEEKERKQQEAEEENELKKRTKSSNEAEERGPTKKTRAEEDVIEVSNKPPEVSTQLESDVSTSQEDKNIESHLRSEASDSTSNDSRTQSSNDSSNDDQDNKIQERSKSSRELDQDSHGGDEKDSKEIDSCKTREKKEPGEETDVVDDTRER